MKLNITAPNIETSGGMEEHIFSISDTRIIFDILRNKMYSNPILAICREVSCNARDAHREVGKFDLPIEIQLPNAIEPVYKIKDYGPGISPDRMENVFIKYGASTKRDDNVQVGAYGIGAKVPISYTDTFTIITIVDGIKYNYVCYLDESKLGKLLLLSKEDTTEGNGTEIIVPVKKDDFKLFAQWTEFTTKHWDIRPKFTGQEIVYEELKVYLKGSNWAIASDKNRDFYSKDIRVVIDGILYSISQDSAKTYIKNKSLQSLKENLYLFFGTGELSLSASREQIYLDDSTIKLLNDRIDKVFSELFNVISDSIELCDNFWKANVLLKTLMNKVFWNHTTSFSKFTWRKHTLYLDSMQLPCKVTHFTNRIHRQNKTIRQSDACGKIYFTDNSKAYIDDITDADTEISHNHVRHIFAEYPNLDSVLIIKNQDNKDLSAFPIDLMNIEKLSSVSKIKLRSKKINKDKVLYYVYSVRNKKFILTSKKKLIEDKGKCILCPINESKLIDLSNLRKSRGISTYYLNANQFVCHFNYTFYGVSTEYYDDCLKLGIRSFESLVEEAFPMEKKVEYLKHLSANVHYDPYIYSNMKEVATLIESKDSVYLRYLSLLEFISKVDRVNNLNHIRQYMYHTDSTDDDLERFLQANPEYNEKYLSELFRKNYPLLRERYRDNNKDVAYYVNLIDKYGVRE